MAVMAREAWTDERLDDLNGRVEKGFDRVDKDIRELRSDMQRMDGKLDSLKSDMNGRFDSMQRTMIVCFVTLFASIWAAVIGAVLAALF